MCNKPAGGEQEEDQDQGGNDDRQETKADTCKRRSSEATTRRGGEAETNLSRNQHITGRSHNQGPGQETQSVARLERASRLNGEGKK